jgi:serine/threonine-protein kinase
MPAATWASTVSGRYDLMKVIGSGGMAVVWLAHDRHLNRNVAVKMLSPSVAEDPTFQARFRREARHVASLSHPNIVQIYDFGIDGNQPFIVMEYLVGDSLRSVLNHVPLLPVPAAADLAVQSLSALSQAHHLGIVHRDLKPSNILVSPTGDVKLVDFGVAKSIRDATEVTGHGSFVGTAAYASPEQRSGRPLGPSSDLYSMGCVLYRCLTGRLASDADNPETDAPQHGGSVFPAIASIRDDVPDSMVQAVETALEEDPAQRFGSARAMASAFEPLAGEGLGDLVAPPVDSSRPSVEASAGDLTTEASSGSPLADDVPTRVRTRLSGVKSGVRTRRQRRLWAGLGVAIVVLATAIGFAWRLDGSPSSVSSRPSTIQSGGFLQPGQSIASPNGGFLLTMQRDGNLVEYRTRDATVQWASATSGNFGAYAVVQVDGNFVVYPNGRSAPAPGQPTPALWSTGTFVHHAYVVLEDSGRTVLREPGTRTILWSAPSGPNSGS